MTDELDDILNDAINEAPEKAKTVELNPEDESDSILDPIIPLSMDNIVFEDPNPVSEVNSDDEDKENINDMPVQPIIRVSRQALKIGKSRRAIVILPKQGE